MRLWAATLSAIVAVSCSSVAVAGPVADAAARAEVLQAEGKTLEALGALEEAVDAVWTQSPLVFRSVRLVEPGGTGADQVDRPNSSFNPGESLIVYLEPVGYGFGAASTIDLGIGLAVENATGQVLSEAPDLFSFSTEAPTRRRDVGLTVAFKVPALYPADYKAVFTMRDRNSDKSATFDIPFTIAVPGAATPASDGAAPAAEPSATAEPSAAGDAGAAGAPASATGADPAAAAEPAGQHGSGDSASEGAPADAQRSPN